MLLTTRDNFNRFVDILSHRHPGLISDQLKNVMGRDFCITFKINVSGQGEHKGVGELLVVFPTDRLMHNFVIKPLGVHSERLVNPLLDNLRKEFLEILSLVEAK